MRHVERELRGGHLGGAAQASSVIPPCFAAARSKVTVRSQPAFAADRSIRQSAKSALPPRKTRSALQPLQARRRAKVRAQHLGRAPDWESLQEGPRRALKRANPLDLHRGSRDAWRVWTVDVLRVHPSRGKKREQPQRRAFCRTIGTSHRCDHPDLTGLQGLVLIIWGGTRIGSCSPCGTRDIGCWRSACCDGRRRQFPVEGWLVRSSG